MAMNVRSKDHQREDINRLIGCLIRYDFNLVVHSLDVIFVVRIDVLSTHVLVHLIE